MCGITGIINWKNNVRAEKTTVRKMAETLSSRGPDDSQVWVSSHAAFGHKRLAVVDPAGGKQPMNKKHNSITYTLVDRKSVV